MEPSTPVYDAVLSPYGRPTNAWPFLDRHELLSQEILMDFDDGDYLGRELRKSMSTLLEYEFPDYEISVIADRPGGRDKKAD